MSKTEEKSKTKYIALEMDIIGAILKGIICYSILLIWNYWDSLETKGDFYPYAYLYIFLVAIVFLYFDYRKRDKKSDFLYVALVVFCFLLSILIFPGDKSVLVCSVALLSERYILSHFFGSLERQRFTIKKYSKACGILLCVSPMICVVESPYKDTSDRLQQCMLYLSIMFILYLVLSVFYRYLQEEYIFFRGRMNFKTAMVRRIKRMNRIVLAILLVLFSGVIFFAKETFVRIFSTIIGFVLVFVFNGVSFITEPVLDKLMAMFNVGGNMTQHVGTQGLRTALGEGNSIAYIVFIGGICIAVFLVVSVFFLGMYKKNLSSYEIGEEVATFIAKDEIDESGKGVYRKKRKRIIRFEDNERGNIRKIYFENINNKFRARDIQVVNSKTPRELERIYLKDNGHANEITRLYEKARYSNERCTKDEVKRLEELV